MEKLSVFEIIKKISNEETFCAVVDDYSFTLKIEAYVPYACAAIHNGHQFRRELWDNCFYNQYQRWFEEDPLTKKFISTHPIVIAGCDSRFEYDLNRSSENAIYKEAWGKEVWKTPLQPEEQKKSLDKYHKFYKVIDALISKLENKFSACVVYDIHSYNWRRWDREVPVVNIGTSNVNKLRYKNSIESWRLSLKDLELPSPIKTTSAINNTFYGNGYFLKYITKRYPDTLVLATEFKKIYCDEQKQIIFPEIVCAIQRQLFVKIKAHANMFYNAHKK